MIAFSGFYDAFSDCECNSTCVTVSTYAVTSTSCEYFYFPKETETPDPKKRTPFYRGFVKLNPPAVAELKICTPKKRKWNPSMGRVRIDRTRL